jgi:hypothetical protein
VTYTVVLSNSGAADANGVLLTDTLPSEVDFSRWVQQSGANETADLITWNGTVAANDRVTISFVVNHVGDYGDVVTNTAEYSFAAGGGVTGNAEVTFTVKPEVVGVPPARPIYFPLIMKAVSPPPPDLIVESLVANSNAVTVVIKNVGPGPVDDAFWVDVYIDPDPPPTRVNQHWFDLGDEGIVWGVTALPIDPGETLTVTIGDAYYVGPPVSQFSLPLVVGSPIYAQVDSVNLLTNYGGVLESHEITSGAYNNITGTVVIAAGSAAAVPAAANGQKTLSDMLPPR